MKVLRELKNYRANVVVFTGNGAAEAGLLDWLCEKFDGKAKFLWFPESPLGKGRKEIALRALDALSHYTTYGRLRKFLFLVDREHLPRQADESSRVHDYLEKLGASVHEVATLVPKKAFVFAGGFGTQSFELCVVIVGTTLRMEEEISNLIHEVQGIDLSGDMKTIRRGLRTQGKDLRSIVSNASIKQLDKAFPGLCSALKWIEKQDAG